MNGFFGTDPLPGLADYVRRPHRQTTFYISAYCDPAVFDALDGYDVKLWFAHQDGVEFPAKMPEGAETIPGGTTAITRAPFLARCLGFRDVTLYGADSSFAGVTRQEGDQLIFEGQRYSYKDGTYAEDSKSGVKGPIVTADGKGPFWSEVPLLQQVAQLGVMHTHQTWGVKLNIRCHGLMDAFIKAPLETDDGEVISA